MIEPNSKIYSDECDRLSTLEVQNCNTFWGRWYVEDGMLCTWVCTPLDGKLPLKKVNLFCYAVEKLRSSKGQSEFLTQISNVEWLGEKGLKQAKRTLKYFKKNGVENLDNNE